MAYNHPLSILGWLEHWPALKGLGAALEARLGSQAYQAAWSRGKTSDMQQLVEAFRDASLPVPL